MPWKSDLTKKLPLVFLFIIFSCTIEQNNSLLNRVVIPQETLPKEKTDGFLILTNSGKQPEQAPIILVNNRTVSQGLIDSDINMSNISNYNPQKMNIEVDLNKSSAARGVDLVNFENYTKDDKRNFSIYFRNFTALNEPASKESIEFTLKKRVTIPETDSIELFIWSDINDVENSIEYINFLAESFFQIYKSMVSIFGDYWGENIYSNTIPWDNRDIHLLLTDIDRDKNQINPVSGNVYGYFDGNDLFQTMDSNGCINLVIDAYSYFASQNFKTAKNTAILKSTIIHEFQHLIHFYQKTLKTGDSDTFFNEMFSMIAEDILAKSHLGFQNNLEMSFVISPDVERVPVFNTSWANSSIFQWDTTRPLLESYGRSYMFGAYLIRNYKFQLIKEYLKSSKNGKEGLLEAMDTIDSSKKHSINSLLIDFGTAIIKSRSSDTASPHRLNNNTVQVIQNNEYELFPINVFSNFYINTFKSIPLEKSSELQTIKEESNTYIYLGKIDYSDKIYIENLGENTEYKIIF